MIGPYFYIMSPKSTFPLHIARGEVIVNLFMLPWQELPEYLIPQQPATTREPNVLASVFQEP